jgi:hypothetical protein
VLVGKAAPRLRVRPGKAPKAPEMTLTACEETVRRLSDTERVRRGAGTRRF